MPLAMTLISKAIATATEGITGMAALATEILALTNLQRDDRHHAALAIEHQLNRFAEAILEQATANGQCPTNAASSSPAAPNT